MLLLNGQPQSVVANLGEPVTYSAPGGSDIALWTAPEATECIGTPQFGWTYLALDYSQSITGSTIPGVIYIQVRSHENPTLVDACHLISWVPAENGGVPTLLVNGASADAQVELGTNITLTGPAYTDLAIWVSETAGVGCSGEPTTDWMRQELAILAPFRSPTQPVTVSFQLCWTNNPTVMGPCVSVEYVDTNATTQPWLKLNDNEADVVTTVNGAVRVTSPAGVDLGTWTSEAGPVGCVGDPANGWIPLADALDQTINGVGIDVTIAIQVRWHNHPERKSACRTVTFQSAPTPSATETPSQTPTVTATPSETPLLTVTPSETPSVTVTPSETPSVTVTPSETPAVTVTPSETPSVTVTPSETPSVTVTPSETPSVTVTPSETPSETPAVTVTPSETPAVTVTPSETPAVTVTPETPVVTIVPAVTATPGNTPTVAPEPIRILIDPLVDWPIVGAPWSLFAETASQQPPGAYRTGIVGPSNIIELIDVLPGYYRLDIAPATGDTITRYVTVLPGGIALVQIPTPTPSSTASSGETATVAPTATVVSRVSTLPETGAGNSSAAATTFMMLAAGMALIAIGGIAFHDRRSR